MSTTAIFVLDDIIYTNTLYPLEGQRALYESFAHTHRMAVVTTHHEREAVRLFLRHNHYRYDLLMNKEDTLALDDTSWKVQCVRDIRAMGWPVGCYLDCDPEAVRRVYADGTTALMLVHRLSRPQWLPDAREPRPWTELVAFSEAQRERAAATDPAEPRPWDQSVVP
jgi:hypothetical protein